ncbi:MAG: NADPH:quinone oxidoreductase family protein [Polyangiales bacterium]
MNHGLSRALHSREGLIFQEVPSKSLGPSEVRIAVHAAGVNYPDVLQLHGRSSSSPALPYVPGSEISGEVIETASDVTSPRVGDRVMALVGLGGYASEVVTAADSCIVLPSQMDYVTAAGFLVSYGTAYYALVQRAQLRSGEILLVHNAASELGSAALDIGRNLGGRPIAIEDSDERLQRVADRFHVGQLINSRAQPRWMDRVKELTLAGGADVIYDSIVNDTIEGSVRCVAWGGRVLVLGSTGDTAPRVAANLLLRRNAALVGTYWHEWVGRDRARNQQNFTEMFAWFELGRLQPVVAHTAPLNRAKEVLEALSQRQIVGKCVLTMR